MTRIKNITIHVPEELRKEILVRAIEQGITLKDYIVGLINEDLNEQEQGGASNE